MSTSVITVDSLDGAKAAISDCLSGGDLAGAVGVAQCLWVLGKPGDVATCRQQLAEEARERVLQGPLEPDESLAPLFAALETDLLLCA